MNRLTAGFIGFVAALLLIPTFGYLFLAFGNPPVTVADKPFPFEAQIVRIPRHTRIHREMPKSSPLDQNDANLGAGARIYNQDCAACHGLQDQASPFGKTMYPRAPDLWEKHKNGVVGVSDDPVGETYWKVKNGIRLTGMPAFQSLLTETQMWQVSMLLSLANKPLPIEATEVLNKPTH